MEKSGDIINIIKETILRYRMIAPGDRVIVALSGGPDSVCLLHAMNRLSPELETTLVAAHYNHALRGAEDEFETQMARDIAISMGLPFETEKASGLLDSRSSLEERARQARYTFLEKIRSKYKAQRIAMGHNLNDQAETVLMRLLRGSGPLGLSGIPPVRDNIIIRPLIEIKREEIVQYLKTNGLPFATDSSNSEKRYLRNRIRLELLPMMLDYEPKALERLGRVSKILRDEEALLESLAREWIERETTRNNPNCLSVNISAFKMLPAPLKNRVIRGLLKIFREDLYPLEYDNILSIIKLMDNEKPQCSLDIPNGIIVRKTYGNLIISLKGDKRKIEYSYSIKGPCTYHLDAAEKILILEEIEKAADIFGHSDLSTAYLDADKLRFPLVARNFRHGDRFIPLGMKGHKKVKDFFIDIKVPLEKRALTPVLTSEDMIVWVCGYRIDERFKVTTRTKRILKASLIPR